MDGLRHDIRNIIPHVFGSHQQCRNYFCSKNVGTTSSASSSALDVLRGNEKVYDAVMKTMERVAVDADRLRLGLETNIAERCFSSGAKFVGGKRQNLSNLGSYDRRFKMMLLLQNEGYGWPKELIEKFAGTEPGPVFEKYATQREMQKVYTEKSKNRPEFVRCSKTFGREDAYGEEAMVLQRHISEQEKLEKIIEYRVRY